MDQETREELEIEEVHTERMILEQLESIANALHRIAVRLELKD